MATETFTLINDKTKEKFKLNVIKGSYGPKVIDVRNLYSKTKYFTYDPGFMSTASCVSDITYIDGEKGELYYRGYGIEELAQNSNYLEVCYLLLNKELPNKKELNEFDLTVRNHTMLHESVRDFYKGFHYDAHPMAITLAIIGALSSFYHDSIDIKNPKHRVISAFRLIAKMPTIAAYSYRHSMGLPLTYPNNEYNYTENFLHMMFDVPTRNYKPDPTAVKALDLILILHADHEQNASTSSVRLSGSSGTNPFASIAAGIASLWGPGHGGANEAVIRMLEEIGDISNIDKYIERAKDKNDSFRLMGFGHRVYKNYDPRAKIIKAICHEVLEKFCKNNNPLFEIALELEKRAEQEEYFISRSLYPNVDFYSGLILRAIDIPLSMFTLIFAMARTAGWIAQWNEMLDDPVMKISRPRQLYSGSKPRKYIKIQER